ncbi:unnamed protein product, partial [Polarella glacialis]
AYKSPGLGGQLFRRPGDQGLVSVRAAPVGCYLKAKGSQPPRTWVSGLAERLRGAGAADFVDAAQAWYVQSVDHLLKDPKAADMEGDYFIALLRECHREIYNDIDRSDPEELRGLDFVASLSNPKSKQHRYDLKKIRIPGFEEAFAELYKFKPSEGKPSSRKQRVLAKIMVDCFQLRMVDLAAVLVVGDCVTAAPPGSEVVVVMYAGGDHSKTVAEFFRARGFDSEGLVRNGLVGKENWEDDEPRGLTLPSYLHDFGELFGQE